MLFLAKLERFGKQFFEDYTKIIEMSLDKVKEYIDGLQASKRKILIADTYFSIVQGRKAKFDADQTQRVPYA